MNRRHTAFCEMTELPSEKQTAAENDTVRGNLPRFFMSPCIHPYTVVRMQHARV